MLRLVGEKAYGWLPTLSYLAPSALRDANEIIDGSARAHGRDPREVRRRLNVFGSFNTSAEPFLGTPENWVEQLLLHMLEDGISTFILVGDDPQVIETLAREVAPAVREQVAVEGASRGTQFVAQRLVPAIMRLTGRATWWAPGPLRRFHARFGLSEGETAAVAGTEPDRDKVGARG